MKRSIHTVWRAGATVVVSLFGSFAFAGPASKVYTPIVEMGETEIEIYGGYASDDGRGETEYKLGVGHGMTQRWFSEIELEWEREQSGPVDYRGWEWVNIFQLTEQGEYIVDLGFFTELKFPDEHDDANAIEFGPMFQKEIGPTTYNLNLIWVRDYGHQADDNTEFEYTFQARVKGDPVLEYGFQAFGEMGDWSDMPAAGDQEHKLGPAIFGEMPAGGKNKIAYDAAFLLGATDDTADYTVRFEIEYEMY